MDLKISTAVVKATQDVFRIMVRKDVHAGPPFERNPDFQPTDLSGIIQLTGPDSGSIVVHFPLSLAQSFGEALLGNPIRKSEPDSVVDTVGELTNMIAGGFRNTISTDGLNFEISIPRVVSGQQYIDYIEKDSPRVYIPFESDGQRFIVQVLLKKS